MLNIRYSKQAQRFLKNLNKIDKERIFNSMKRLADDPYPPNIIKLKGMDYYRIRAGKHRILYNVDRKGNLLDIVKIDKRGRAYDKK